MKQSTSERATVAGEVVKNKIKANSERRIELYRDSWRRVSWWCWTGWSRRRPFRRAANDRRKLNIEIAASAARDRHRSNYLRTMTSASFSSSVNIRSKNVRIGERETVGINERHRRSTVAGEVTSAAASNDVGGGRSVLKWPVAVGRPSGGLADARWSTARGFDFVDR